MELTLQESVYKDAHTAHVEARDKFDSEVLNLYKVNNAAVADFEVLLLFLMHELFRILRMLSEHLGNFRIVSTLVPHRVLLVERTTCDTCYHHML